MHVLLLLGRCTATVTYFTCSAFNCEGYIFEANGSFWSWSFCDGQFRHDQKLSYIAVLLLRVEFHHFVWINCQSLASSDFPITLALRASSSRLLSLSTEVHEGCPCIQDFFLISKVSASGSSDN